MTKIQLLFVIIAIINITVMVSIDKREYNFDKIRFLCITAWICAILWCLTPLINK